MSEPTTLPSGASVLVEVAEQVATVTLNRPQVLNAMTLEMADAYARTLHALDRDPQVRAIVVTGAGRGFCAGADLSVLAGGSATIRQFLPPRPSLPLFTLELATPVIAAVNGPVAGIGFAYMICSDVRFAAADASISTTFARLGLVAEYGLSWLLPRLVGVGAALDLLLSARTVSAAEAHRLGLVQHVVAAGEALAAARGYALELAERCSPWSMATIKSQVYRHLELDRDAALNDSLALMDASFDAADLAEALVARRDGRPPAFPPLAADASARPEP